MEDSQSIIMLLKKADVFLDFSQELLSQVAYISSYKKLSRNEILIQEGNPAEHIYVIVKGRFSIFKETHEELSSAEFGMLEPGNIVGELSFLDGQPRSANVKSLDEDSLVLEIPFKKLEKLAPVHFYRKLAKRLSHNIRANNQVIVESLKKEVERNKKVANMGRFVIYVLVLLSIYTLALKGLAPYSTNPYTSMFVSTSVIAVFTIVLTVMIYQTGHPFSYYGLNLHNWKKALWESLFFTSIAIIIITGIKWLLIMLSSRGGTIFSNMHFLVPKTIVGTREFPIWIETAMLVYSIFAILQEFIARGVLQGSLADLLHLRYKNLWANIVTSIVFSAMHIHLHSHLAYVLFIPSLFWGWLYTRHRTLLSPAISHVLMGGWAIFALGIEDFLS